ncbi:hypothetical protein B0T22DRAFT_171754 [Podospora appendiculata]|uniref:Fungal STAND N-terminal Goodbye domain-containing protein n=1 Tax=Podospora appendiculata TaxID=314037 RepID=A0AAE1CDD8_9PEZI|nr:hypothetical protein B0T22DRAFT_171754 [Podospora appendiculata]
MSENIAPSRRGMNVETGEYEVVEYMDNMQGSLHPALTRGPIFDQETNRWVQKRPGTPVVLDYNELYSECFDARDMLKNTANKYLAKTKQTPIDIDLGHDWTTVQLSMERACQTLDKAAALDKDVTGFTGKLKKGFNALCQNAGAGKLFTALIPSDLMFASALCGGLNVIFTALEQTGFHREAVYSALERLPVILSNHDGYILIAADDAELHRRTAKLYAGVCLTLNHILNWFMMNSFVAGAKRLLKPSGFTTKLNDRLGEVKLAAKDFKSHVLRMMMQRQDDLLQLQSRDSHEQAKISRQVNEIGYGVHQLLERADFYESAQAKVFERLQPFLQNIMQKLIADNIPAQAALPSPRSKRPPPKVTPLKILKALLYDPELIKNDLTDLLKLGTPGRSGPTTLDPTRVHALQRNPRMRAWLTIDESSALLLHSGAEPLSLDTSFFMATMVSSLLEEKSKPNKSITVVTLAYFCGQHRDYRRDVAGSPEEMAMNLLLQLIDQYRDFEGADLQECLNSTVPGDVFSICASFGRLVQCLPADVVVFVVIDGIQVFAAPPERRSRSRDVVEALLRVYGSLPRDATFKLLVASPTRSKFVEDLFEEDELIHIPADPPPLGDYRDGLV